LKKLSVNNRNRLLFTSQALLIMLFILLLYTFLHEAGHAISGMLFGQRLLEFDAAFWKFDPHVSLAGDLPLMKQAIRSLMGTGLPLLVWVVFILLVPRKAYFSLTVLKIFSSMAIINTLLTWIGLPILIVSGQTVQDDVAFFLNTSGIQPLLLSGIGLILYAAGWWLFIHRMEGFKEQYRFFRSNDPDFLISGSLQTSTTLATIAVPLLFVILTSSSFLPGKYANPVVPPPGYQQVVSINLQDQAVNEMTVFQFTVEEPELVGLYVQLNNIDTSYFDITLTGPAGFEKVLLHGEGYSASKDTTLFEERLAAGEYELVLTSDQSPGKMSVYFHTP